MSLSPIADGVTEEENVEEYANQYRDPEPEPEGQYLDQDFPEGFENGKFNPILWCMFCSSFYKHNLLACFTKLHMFCLLKTWLDSHPLICYNHSLTT